MNGELRLAVIAALLMPGSVVGQWKDVPAYSLAPIRYELQDGDQIGKKGAGLICGPAGRLRWSDVKPDRVRITGVVTTALRDAGLDVFVPNDVELEDGVVRGGRRIYAKITALTLDACVSGWGPLRKLTGPGSWKGAGAIAVEWRVYDAITRSQVGEVKTCMNFRQAKADTPPRLAEAALRASAAEFARRYLSDPSQPAPSAPADCSTFAGGAMNAN